MSYHFNVLPELATALIALAVAPKQYCVTFDGFVVGAAGNAFTVTVTWSVPVHPFASVPVTVYVVVTVGVNETPLVIPPVQL
jgi:hypothetical protein